MKRFKAALIDMDGVLYDSMRGHAASWKKMGVLAVEMESVALYMNAARAGKKALALLTVSDLIFGSEAMSAKEREQGLTAMIETALELSAAV